MAPPSSNRRSTRVKSGPQAVEKKANARKSALRIKKTIQKDVKKGPSADKAKPEVVTSVAEVPKSILRSNPRRARSQVGQRKNPLEVFPKVTSKIEQLAKKAKEKVAAKNVGGEAEVQKTSSPVTRSRRSSKAAEQVSKPVTKDSLRERSLRSRWRTAQPEEKPEKAVPKATNRTGIRTKDAKKRPGTSQPAVAEAQLKSPVIARSRRSVSSVQEGHPQQDSTPQAESGMRSLRARSRTAQPKEDPVEPLPKVFKRAKNGRAASNTKPDLLPSGTKASTLRSNPRRTRSQVGQRKNPLEVFPKVTTKIEELVKKGKEKVAATNGSDQAQVQKTSSPVATSRRSSKAAEQVSKPATKDSLRERSLRSRSRTAQPEKPEKAVPKVTNQTGSRTKGKRSLRARSRTAQPNEDPVEPRPKVFKRAKNAASNAKSDLLPSGTEASTLRSNPRRTRSQVGQRKNPLEVFPKVTSKIEELVKKAKEKVAAKNVGGEAEVRKTSSPVTRSRRSSKAAEQVSKPATKGSRREQSLRSRLRTAQPEEKAVLKATNQTGNRTKDAKKRPGTSQPVVAEAQLKSPVTARSRRSVSSPLEGHPQQDSAPQVESVMRSLRAPSRTAQPEEKPEKAVPKVTNQTGSRTKGMRSLRARSRTAQPKEDPVEPRPKVFKRAKNGEELWFSTASNAKPDLLPSATEASTLRSNPRRTRSQVGQRKNPLEVFPKVTTKIEELVKKGKEKVAATNGSDQAQVQKTSSPVATSRRSSKAAEQVPEPATNDSLRERSLRSRSRTAQPEKPEKAVPKVTNQTGSRTKGKRSLRARSRTAQPKEDPVEPLPKVFKRAKNGRTARNAKPDLLPSAAEAPTLRSNPRTTRSEVGQRKNPLEAFPKVTSITEQLAKKAQEKAVDQPGAMESQGTSSPVVKPRRAPKDLEPDFKPATDDRPRKRSLRDRSQTALPKEESAKPVPKATMQTRKRARNAREELGTSHPEEAESQETNQTVATLSAPKPQDDIPRQDSSKKDPKENLDEAAKDSYTPKENFDDLDVDDVIWDFFARQRNKEALKEIFGFDQRVNIRLKRILKGRPPTLATMYACLK
ncbi:hypothetical protein L596_023246 [Steinernema carpocapsae]|uniref:Uncharacterized protein n=1 Tax=Steinernema carpocapsae TaxID=34508 RepID=A0A4U5MD42_STECR|nr:hypothetical protein L596_023246 [Steinernema carpocapsae]